MIAYKGFSKDMTARMGKGKYQFKQGRKEVEKEAKCANTGFHCAEDPLDVLGYYNRSDDRYFIVKAEGDINEDGDGTRISCTEITPVKELSKEKLILHACNFIMNHPEREWNSHVEKEKGKAKSDYVIVRGKNPKAAGKKGSMLCLLQEFRTSQRIKRVSIYEVDGKDVKENIFYDAYGEVSDD